MQPYRDLFPHADLVLPHTRTLSESVIVLPNGTSLPDGAITLIADVLRNLVQASSQD